MKTQNFATETIKFSYRGKNVEFLAPSLDASAFGGQMSTENVAKLGKEILKYFNEKAINRTFTSKSDKKKVEQFYTEVLGVEGMPMVQEDLTFPDNTALYTTIVRNVVERAFRPNLIMSGFIRSISVDPKGVSTIKFPISVLKTAYDLPDNGDLSSPTGGDYDHQEIDLKWIYSYEVITWQLIQQAVIDVIQDQLYEMGYALSRKIDSDIVSAIEAASPSSNVNNNYLALGTGNKFSYNALMEGVLKSEMNFAVPDSIITNPLTLLNFMKDTSVITALGYNSQELGTLFPRVRQFFGLQMLTTTQATQGNVYILDSNRTKYFVEGSPIQVLDGRKSGTTNWEIIALKLYGVKIVQPKAVYRLVENVNPVASS